MMMIGHNGNVIITLLLFIFVFNLIVSDAGIPFQLSFDVNGETMDYLLIDSGYCCDGKHDSAQETLSQASYGNIEEVSPKIFSLYLASLVYHSFFFVSSTRRYTLEIPFTVREASGSQEHCCFSSALVHKSIWVYCKSKSRFHFKYILSRKMEH